MGYYAFAVGLKINDLQEAIGSNDQALLDKVRKTEHFAEVYSDVATEDGHFTIDDALKELIAGDISRADAGYVYGYALICLSYALGRELPLQGEIKLYVETEFIDQLLQKSYDLQGFELIEEIFPDKGDWHQYVPLLPEIEDWPSGSYIPLARLKKLQLQLIGVQISEEQISEWEESDDDEDEERASAAEQILALQANLAFCIEHGLDMGWFAH